MARAATRILRASAGAAWLGASDTGDLPGFEFRNVGYGAPGTVRRIMGRELARPVSLLIRDVPHAAALRREQGDSMMHRVDPQQRSLADPIADPRVAHRGPKGFILARSGRVQSDVGEARDAGIARREVAPPAVRRAGHQLDGIAARIFEHDERVHLPLLALEPRAGTHAMTRVVEFGRGGLEFADGADLEGDALVAGIARGIGQRMVAVIGAQIRIPAVATNEFKTQDLRGVADSVVEVGSPQAYITNVFERYHRPRSLALTPPIPQCSAGTSVRITRILSGLTFSVSAMAAVTARISDSLSSGSRPWSICRLAIGM